MGLFDGYRLARPDAEITVADVVAALRIWLVDGHASTSQADDVGDRLAALWRRVGGATEDVLSSVTVADVAVGSAPVGAS